MTTPLISVIIPVYNCVEYLQAALSTALDQAGVSLEVLLVDNSTDDSCKGYSNYPDPRVRYVFRQPPGVSAARNLGIRLSKGKFLAFLDADDEWLPQKLSEQVAAFEEFPGAGLVFTDTMMCSDQKIFRETMYKDVLESWAQAHRSDSRNRYYGDLYARLLENNCMHTSSVMVRREVLEESGLFDERFTIGEDYDLWLRIARTHPMVYLDQVYCRYRVREDGLSGGNHVRGVRWLEAHIAVREKHRRAGWVLAKHNDLLSDVLAKRYWELGWSHFGCNRFQEARTCFIESLRARPFRPKIWVYLCSSFLPVTVIESIRTIRQAWKAEAIG